MSIAGIHLPTMQKDEWLTPPEIIKSLGVFDLDPCAPHPDKRPWNTANNHLHKELDGLNSNWFGRVWLNPPYGRETSKWLDKLSLHGNGIALIFARTETKMFFNSVWNKADAIFFFNGRLTFYNVNGTKAKANSGAPSCLIIYGKENITSVKNSNLNGKLIEIKND